MNDLNAPFFPRVYANTAFSLHAPICHSDRHSSQILSLPKWTTIFSGSNSLRDRGLTISDKGMSVRTTGRYSREDYVDATQRGLMKAMGASSFATADNVDGKTTSHSVLDNTPDGGLKFSMPALNRQLSEASILSNSSGSDKEKKKSRFRLRKKSSAWELGFLIWVFLLWLSDSF